VKLSVITINRNDCPGLKRTVESVLSQTYQDYEYVVVDGASQDGSREFLEANARRFHFWISEPDRGIYDAMNKGIRAARGEYCLFLNSGDWLANDAILETVFSVPVWADIVSGDIFFYDNEKGEVKWHVPSPEVLTAKTLFLGTLPHQATLIRRELFSRFGYYDEQLRITSDWQFFVQVLLEKGVSYQHIPHTLAYFNMDGISCRPATGGLARQEQLTLLRAKYPRFLPDYLRLEALESEAHRWEGSHEKTVFVFLKKCGVIPLGVLTVRLFRYINRVLTNART
jgi:glycosyltransferase involved in cell wall biosynthesis